VDDAVVMEVVDGIEDRADDGDLDTCPLRG